jgi:hypothetical protein
MALRQNLWVDDSRLKENERLIAIMSEKPTAQPFWSTAIICRLPFARTRTAVCRQQSSGLQQEEP